MNSRIRNIRIDIMKGMSIIAVVLFYSGFPYFIYFQFITHVLHDLRVFGE